MPVPFKCRWPALALERQTCCPGNDLESAAAVTSVHEKKTMMEFEMEDAG